MELLSGNGEKTEIAPDMSSAYNAGKGAIIDSGSTDTFLPKAIAVQFHAALNKYTGLDISQDPFSLPTDVGAEKFRKSLPSFVFSLQSTDSSSSTPIEVVIPPGRYLESVGTDKYQFSLYATEPEGMVLGANFISGYNVIFETEKNRIGFALSECNYELVQKNYMIDDGGGGNVGPALADKDKEDGSVEQSTDCVKIPMTACSAMCDKTDNKAYQSKGKLMMMMMICDVMMMMRIIMMMIMIMILMIMMMTDDHDDDDDTDDHDDDHDDYDDDDYDF